jgi:hypothetical protein
MLSFLKADLIRFTVVEILTKALLVRSRMEDELHDFTAQLSDGSGSFEVTVLEAAEAIALKPASGRPNLGHQNAIWR